MGSISQCGLVNSIYFFFPDGTQGAFHHPWQLEPDKIQHWLGTTWLHLSSTTPWNEGSHIPMDGVTEGQRRLSLQSHTADQTRSPDLLILKSWALSCGPHSPPWWKPDPHHQFHPKSSLLAWGWRRASVTWGALPGAWGFRLVAASTRATWARGQTLK